MPIFETPQPISVTVELSVATVRVTASDRTDTVVEVRPSNRADESDVQAAEAVRVAYADGALQVTGPRRTFDFSRKTRSVDVSLDLPIGSALAVHLQLGEVHGVGLIGDCQLKTTGDIRFAHTGSLRLRTGMGHVSVGGIDGNADVSTASGRVQLGEINGNATVKTANGAAAVDAVTGDLRIRSANGDITIGRAAGVVDAKTANGDIRLGTFVRGTAVLLTAAGDLEIGVPAETAAWLDVTTGYGQVRNLLDTVHGPDSAADTVEVRGRTAYGDVTIRRS